MVKCRETVLSTDMVAQANPRRNWSMATMLSLITLIDLQFARSICDKMVVGGVTQDHGVSNNHKPKPYFPEATLLIRVKWGRGLINHRSIPVVVFVGFLPPPTILHTKRY